MEYGKILIFCLSFFLVQLSSTDELSIAPIQSKIQKTLNIQPVPPMKKFRRNRWTGTAISKMMKEKERVTKTPLVPLEYEGAPMVDIIFKDETIFPGGSHFRTAWMLLLKLLKTSSINRGTHLFDGSFGGNSAVATAHFAKLLGIKYTVFVPIEMAQGKLQELLSLGANVIRAHISLLVNRPKEEAAKISNGFYLNYPGSFSDVSSFDNPNMNIFDEFSQQLENEENITNIDFFISTVSTGSIVNTISSSISRNNAKTQLIAVDSQFSGIYDFIVNNKFTNISSLGVWRTPGIQEVGAGPAAPFITGLTTSLRNGLFDEIYKLPDLSVVAAMSVMREKGIEGGPSTAANFLVALVVASTNSVPGNFTTIATFIEDSPDLYTETYLNESWVMKNFARHGARLGYDCWRRVIEEAMFTGWNPIQMGLDKGCASGWR